jgi:hypothetical protein
MNAESLLAAGAILMAVVLIMRGEARPAAENKTHAPPGSSGEGQYGLPGDSSDIFRNNARIIHASG